MRLELGGALTGARSRVVARGTPPMTGDRQGVRAVRRRAEPKARCQMTDNTRERRGDAMTTASSTLAGRVAILVGASRGIGAVTSAEHPSAQTARASA
jgi:hypothetical protein